MTDKKKKTFSLDGIPIVSTSKVPNFPRDIPVEWQENIDDVSVIIPEVLHHEHWTEPPSIKWWNPVSWWRRLRFQPRKLASIAEIISRKQPLYDDVPKIEWKGSSKK